MHKAINRFRTFARRASLNHKRTVFVLKCDIRKFFASVDQYILLEIVKGYIPDKDIVGLISEIILVGAFLKEKLKLDLHPNKVSIRTVASGIDYLGWVHFPDHRVLRTVTKKRMIRGIRRRQGKMETVQSYLGVLSHGNGRRLCGRVDELAATYREKK